MLIDKPPIQVSVLLRGGGLRLIDKVGFWVWVKGLEVPRVIPVSIQDAHRAPLDAFVERDFLVAVDVGIRLSIARVRPRSVESPWTGPLAVPARVALDDFGPNPLATLRVR